MKTPVIRTVIARPASSIWRGMILAAIAMVAAPASAQVTPPTLADLDLETLMQVRVKSVSREEQDVLRTPAAVFVITQEDIRQSGASDVAELLRLVPGLDVASITSSTWAVGSRGFGAQYSTKLLVLVDGRSVYDPGFSGVFWHLLNLRLDGIERIEVVRGPGATMWGANAVNGVISITTKEAADTRGGSASLSFGSARPGDAAMHYGGEIGDADYRVFGRQTSRNDRPTPEGENGGDAWNATDAGFRIDWNFADRDSLMITGGAHRSVSGDRRPIITSLAPLTVEGAGLSGIIASHVSATWTRTLATRSDLQVQAYYDRRRHTRYGAKELEVVDVDLQHSFDAGSRNHLTWGLGYRAAHDSFVNTLAFGLNPAQAATRLGSAFVQNETTLVPDRLFVTVGSKVEYSSFSGANVQPAVRALWSVTPRQSLWGAAGRAVRTPNRVERGMHLHAGAIPLGGDNFALIELSGHEETTSEELLAYEAGYRYQVNRRLWLDAALFHNQYDHLSIVEAGTMFFRPSPVPGLVLPLTFTNGGHGTSRGAELTADYRPYDRLRVRGSYSLLDMDIEVPAGATAVKGRDPRHRGHLSSTLTLPKAVDVTGHVYMTGARPGLEVPSTTRLDLVGSWRAADGLNLRLIGQNLLGPHVELAGEPSPSNPVRRAVFAELAVTF